MTLGHRVVILSYLLFRLGHVEEKYGETESRIAELESRIAELERELIASERDRSDLKGTLASTEGELRALRVESDNDVRRCQQKVGGKL